MASLFLSLSLNRTSRLCPIFLRIGSVSFGFISVSQQYALTHVVAFESNLLHSSFGIYARMHHIRKLLNALWGVIPSTAFVGQRFLK